MALKPFTKEKLDKIAATFRKGSEEGKGIIECCKDAGISADGLYKSMQKNAEFRDQIEAARDLSIAALMKQGRESVYNKDFNVRVWLKLLALKGYGDSWLTRKNSRLYRLKDPIKIVEEIWEEYCRGNVTTDSLDKVGSYLEKWQRIRNNSEFLQRIRALEAKVSQIESQEDELSDA